MEDFCREIRRKILNCESKMVKLTKFVGLDECNDENCYVNCGGIGRIRKYKNFSLFLDNANGCRKRLLRGLDPQTKEFQTQVFQIIGCNMRCWYCFVDDSILNANESNAVWVSISDMIDIFLQEVSEPMILDLSGGQPDLVPEWCLWVMEELERKGLKDKVYVWLDDNLGTQGVMEECLTQEQIKYMASFPKHSRACCFKGFNDDTCTFNMRNSTIGIKNQIENFKFLYEYGFDLYAYITLTGPKGSADKKEIEKFINNMAEIHPKLPLRIIPLKVAEFEATSTRMNQKYYDALQEQFIAYEYWKAVMAERYTREELEMPYEMVKIHSINGSAK